VCEIQAALPAASVTLREHRIAWKPNPRGHTLTTLGVLVAVKVGPFTLRREYAAPDG
jgi:hypothetical protein